MLRSRSRGRRRTHRSGVRVLSALGRWTFFPVQPSPPFAALTDDTIRAAVDEAHRHGKPAFAHPTNAKGLLAALVFSNLRAPAGRDGRGVCSSSPASGSSCAAIRCWPPNATASATSCWRPPRRSSSPSWPRPGARTTPYAAAADIGVRVGKVINRYNVRPFYHRRADRG